MEDNWKLGGELLGFSSGLERTLPLLVLAQPLILSLRRQMMLSEGRQPKHLRTKLSRHRQSGISPTPRIPTFHPRQAEAFRFMLLIYLVSTTSQAPRRLFYNSLGRWLVRARCHFSTR